MENIQLNERILKFVKVRELQIVETVGRAGFEYYKVFTNSDVEIGRVDFNCSYDDFIEHIAHCAVSEIDRLCGIIDELVRDNKQLVDDLSVIRDTILK